MKGRLVDSIAETIISATQMDFSFIGYRMYVKMFVLRECDSALKVTTVPLKIVHFPIRSLGKM